MKKFVTAVLLCTCISLQGLAAGAATISVSQFVEHPAIATPSVQTCVHLPRMSIRKKEVPSRP